MQNFKVLIRLRIECRYRSLTAFERAHDMIQVDFDSKLYSNTYSFSEFIIYTTL